LRVINLEDFIKFRPQILDLMRLRDRQKDRLIIA